MRMTYLLVVVSMAPFGGLMALLITGTHFSVSSGIGFLALFGVSVQTGVIMLEYSLEREDGQIGRDDDGNGIKHRTLDLMSGLPDSLRDGFRRSGSVLAMTHMADAGRVTSQ